MYERDEDRALVEAAKDGDRNSMDALVTKYQREIYYLCLKMSGNEEDAEELAQQTFFNALRAIGSFRGRSLFRTWLYQIAMNLCRSHITKRRPTVEFSHETVPDPAPTPLSEVVRGEEAREAVANLKYIAEKQRAAVVLRIFHDLDYEEIGRIIGCSAKTAKVNFHYGIENLRKRMMKNEVLES